MAFINLNADFTSLLLVAERIASALERISPPILEETLSSPKLQKRGLESLVQYGDPNKRWLKENFQSLVHEKGLAPNEEEELIQLALSEYNEVLGLDPNEEL